MINFDEHVEVKDSTFGFKGIICFEDENGKIIFKTHNMILKKGREKIYNTCTGNTSGFNINNCSVVVGYDVNNAPVTADDSYNSFKETIVSTLTGNVSNTDSTTDMSIDFKVSINKTETGSNDSLKINWIGLVFNESDDSKILISRSMFNPIIIPPTRTINITYTVYF